MKKTIVSSLVFLMLISLGHAQTNWDKAKLDSYFQALEENNKFMGSVAVAKNGKILYTKSIGYADLENKIKATENSKYRIGSVTKTFTTVLVLKAVELKKLDLKQTIDRWFPTIKNADSISIHHLLCHRSGIHNFTNDKDYLSWNTKAKTEKEMVAIIAQGGSDFKPDSKAEYSNSNFVLLTYILEKTFAKSYAELVQNYIVQPIGLAHTYVFRPIDPTKNECKSYRYLDAWKAEPETDYTVPLGAGAITSTTSDLTKFADALFAGKLLSAGSLKIMTSIQEGYGYGLFPIPFHNRTGYGHTGGIDGFSSIFSHFPDDTLSYAMTSNGSNYNTNDISIAVLSAIYDKPYEIPRFKTFQVSSEELDTYLGVYGSKQIPLKITFLKIGSTLFAQGTGQPPFALEAIDKDLFKFDPAGAKFEFNVKDKTLKLSQGGGIFIFTKE